MRAIARTARWSLLVAAVLLVGWVPSASTAPPAMISVGHQNGHPWASWSLPAGVESQVVEVATSPATGTDGYFFFENVVDFDLLDASQTYWLSGYQRAPGTYYVHVAGLDWPCFMADLCPVREFTAIHQLVIPAPTPPPVVTTTTPTTTTTPEEAPYVPKYATRLRPAWVKPKRKISAMFRDSALKSDESTDYRVCWKQGKRKGCSSRSTDGAAWDTWTVKAGKSAKRIYFTWTIGKRVIGKRSVLVIW